MIMKHLPRCEIESDIVLLIVSVDFLTVRVYGYCRCHVDVYGFGSHVLQEHAVFLLEHVQRGVADIST